eukprot:8133592-Alexandrium_andersonii.AAC.1
MGTTWRLKAPLPSNGSPHRYAMLCDLEPLESAQPQRGPPPPSPKARSGIYAWLWPWPRKSSSTANQVTPLRGPCHHSVPMQRNHTHKQPV